MDSSEELPQSSGEQPSETSSKTESTMSQSLNELDLPQLVELVKENLRPWATLIVDTALKMKPPSEVEVSRQYYRRLVQTQYKHMLKMLKEITDPAELISLLEQSGFVYELKKTKPDSASDCESSNPSTQQSQSSQDKTND